MGLGSGYTEHDSEEEEGPVMEGKVQVGGIKVPATRLKRRDLVELQKLSKLEAKIAKLKELKKIEKCKRW